MTRWMQLWIVIVPAAKRPKDLCVNDKWQIRLRSEHKKHVPSTRQSALRLGYRFTNRLALPRRLIHRDFKEINMATFAIVLIPQDNYFVTSTEAIEAAKLLMEDCFPDRENEVQYCTYE
ncbi:MAG: hypothetical protein ACU83U_10780 [Gammaproteobacteria bacterium]